MCVYGVYGLRMYMWNVTTQLRFLSIDASVHSFIDSFVHVHTHFIFGLVEVTLHVVCVCVCVCVFACCISNK